MILMLKFGGAALMDKQGQSHALRREVVERSVPLLRQLHQRGWRIVLGHGAGSYGHVPARHLMTLAQSGAVTQAHLTAQQIHRQMEYLQRQVVMLLSDLPVRPLTPHRESDLATTITSLLSQRDIPLIHGDLWYMLGGTPDIRSTEQLFVELLPEIREPDEPALVVQMTDTPGVYRDIEQPELGIITDLQEVPEINVQSYDVTGGMGEKLYRSQQLHNLGASVCITDCQGTLNVLTALLIGTDATLNGSWYR